MPPGVGRCRPASAGRRAALCLAGGSVATSTDVQPVPTTVGSPGAGGLGTVRQLSARVRHVSARSGRFLTSGSIGDGGAGRRRELELFGPGVSKLIWLKPTSNAGSVASLAITRTRSGMCCSASMAIRTWPISEAVSLGASTSS